MKKKRLVKNDAKNSPLAVVVPCFNDWECVRILINEFNQSLKPLGVERFIVVNDASTEIDFFEDHLPINSNFQIETLNLRTNMGHQFAIASGLRHLLLSGWAGTTIVMDSDGEDDPASITILKAALDENPSQIVVARRGKRFNSVAFKLLNSLYRAAFRVLTGKQLNFGNFMAIPITQAQRLILVDDTWNNLAGSVLKHCNQITEVKVNRRRRSSGKSKMNFISLVSHGLGALTVFAEAIFIRMIILSLMVLLSCLVLTSIVLYLKFFTNSSFPGWTTNVLGFSLLLTVQTFAILSTTTISLILAKKKLLPLNYQSASHFISD
jgi:glycosyltransferase involved in cell wall biosynthesis